MLTVECFSCYCCCRAICPTGTINEPWTLNLALVILVSIEMVPFTNSDQLRHTRFLTTHTDHTVASGRPVPWSWGFSRGKKVYFKQVGRKMNKNSARETRSAPHGGLMEPNDCHKEKHGSEGEVKISWLLSEGVQRLLPAFISCCSGRRTCPSELLCGSEADHHKEKAKRTESVSIWVDWLRKRRQAGTYLVMIVRRPGSHFVRKQLLSVRAWRYARDI